MAVSAAVVIPVKAFADAKARLAPVLRAPERAELARTMASQVVAAAYPIPVTIVCDDDEVADWGRAQGARVVWATEPGLDAAVRAGWARISAEGTEVGIVAHGDLPFAARLDRLLRFDGVTLVPDRRDDGTNVAVVPTRVGFSFSYGPGSFTRHLREARRAGEAVRIARVPNRQWDVDTTDDLPPVLSSSPVAAAR